MSRVFGGKEYGYAINALYLIKPVRHADLLKARLWAVDAMFPIRHWLRIIAGDGKDLERTSDGSHMEQVQGYNQGKRVLLYHGDYRYNGSLVVCEVLSMHG